MVTLAKQKKHGKMRRIIANKTLLPPLYGDTGKSNLISTLSIGIAKLDGDGHGIGTCCDGSVRTLSKQEQLKDAFHILDSNHSPHSSTYTRLLQNCLQFKALPETKLVHAHIILTGLNPDVILYTKLLITYAKCRTLVDARQVLDEMPEGNEVSWTTMIAAYAKHGNGEEALTLFYQMQRAGIQPNHFTFASVLPACANLGVLDAGQEIHATVIKSGFLSDLVVSNALLDMYAKCGLVHYTRKVFDEMPERSVVSWTALIAEYARHGHGEQALVLFYRMKQDGIRSDQFAFAGVLPACGNLVALKQGMRVHMDVIRSGCQSDVFVGNALIDMYVKCGSVDDACKVFDEMPERNAASWTAMLGGYAHNGLVDEAFKLFQKMPMRDSVSWNVMVAGYAQNGYLDEALKLFQQMPGQNAGSWDTIVAGYAQKGHLNDALELFEKMPKKDVVSWSAVIAVCAQNGNNEEAMKLFGQMQLTGVKPNLFTFASVLPACANLGALNKGKEVHEDMIRNGIEYNTFVGSALVDMYAKCGSICDASKLFNKMPEQNVVSWNAMIAGYAIHGCGKEAFQIFNEMEHSGARPDHITFVGVLSACCHAGLVDDGLQYFDQMCHKYCITPTTEHYCCIVDLLGRAGCLDEAQDFIDKMPIKPDSSVLGSLLAACRNHTNIELGENVAQRLFELDSENSGHYVLLSNMYAAVGRWDDKERMRKLMKEREVKKTPGQSWIEVNNKVHVFTVGVR